MAEDNNDDVKEQLRKLEQKIDELLKKLLVSGSSKRFAQFQTPLRGWFQIVPKPFGAGIVRW